MHLEIEFWKTLKEKLKDLSHEDDAKANLKKAFELLIYLNKHHSALPSVLEDKWDFFLNNFLVSISKYLTNSHRTYSKEIMNYLNNVLKSIVLLFMKTPLSGKLYECFKTIMDPKRNFNRALNQNPDFSSHLYLLSLKNNFTPKNIQLGQILDAVRTDQTTQQHRWVQGTVRVIKDKQVELFFPEDQTYLTYELNSGLLAPRGTFSFFHTSLPKLPIKSEVDCFVNGRWYCSTILDVKKKSETQFLVGFRKYDPQGPRVDQEEQHYFGQNEINDEWIKVPSFRFLPAHFLSNQQNQLNFDESQDEPNDILLQDFDYLAIGREYTSQSQFLIKLLNDIHPQFDFLCEELARCRDLDLIKDLLLSFDSFSKLFLKKQGQILLEKLGKACIKAVLQTIKANLRSINNQTIDFIFLALNWVFNKINNENIKGNTLVNFQLDLSFIFMNSNILERQIQGLRIVSDLQKNTKLQPILVKWIQDQKVFELLNNKKSHIQLISRQSDLLRLMLDKGVFKNDQFDQLLSQIQKNDHEYKLVVYKLLTDISLSFSVAQVSYLIQKISGQEVIYSQEIDFIFQIISRQRDCQELFAQFLQFLWKIIFQSQDEVNIKEAFDKFIKILNNVKFQQLRIDYLTQATQKLPQSLQSNVVIQIIKQIIESYPSIQFSEQKVTRGSIINYLIQQQNIIKKLLDDLENAKDNKIQQSTFFLSALFDERLEFIYKLIQQAYQQNDFQSFDYIQALYEINVEKAVYEHESNLFFNFVANLQELVEDEQLSDFFKDKLMNAQNFSYFRIKELSFFLKNFCHLNSQHMNQKPNFVLFSSLDIILQKMEFNTLPNELVKLDDLWSICFQVKDKETFEQAIQILIAIYTQCQPEKAHPQSYPLFLHTFMDYFDQYKTTNINELIDIVYAFLNDTEKNGPDSKPAKQIPRCYNTLKLHVQNEINSMNGTVEVKVRDTDLVIDLKKAIGDKVSCFWTLIDIERGQHKLKDSQNGMLLRELNLENGEKLVIYRRPDKEVKQAELLIEGELNPKLVTILTDWFQQFSTEGKMFPQDCSNFTNSCTGDTCESEDKRIKDLYEQYDRGDKGYLSLEDFFDFYREACEKKKRVVWTNLQNKNVQNDLNRNGDPPIHPDSLARNYLYQDKLFLKEIQKYQNNPKVFYLLSRIPDGGQKLTLSSLEQWYQDYDGKSLEYMEHPCKGVRERVYEVLEKNLYVKETMKTIYQDNKPRKNTFFKILNHVADGSFIPDAVRRIEQNNQVKKNLQVLLKLAEKKIHFDFQDLFERLFQSLDQKGLVILLNLYLKLMENHPENVQTFIKTQMIPLLQSLQLDTEQDCSSQKNAGDRVGIRNLGCICYMNAALQQFFMIPALRSGLLMADDAKGVNRVFTPKNRFIDDNLLHQIQLLFAYMQDSIKQDYDPYALCYAFKDFDGSPTNVKQQQDSQEFINILFDKLEGQIAKTPFNKLLDSIFRGQTCNTITCLECKNKKKRHEQFYNLSLDVKNQKSLKESFETFMKEECISDYYCDVCEQKRDIVKNVSVSHCPNYLIIHLKRFIFDMEVMENEKINSSLEFPQQLDLAPYTEDKDQSQDYDLKGVLVHIGVAQFGHYISYIKQEDGKWLEFNDSIVSDFDVSQLEKHCFGGGSQGRFMDFDQNHKTAYMLFYEKKEKSPYVLEYEGLSAYPFDRAQVGTDNQISVDIEKFPLYVPQELKSQVQESNRQFIVQRNLFHPQFTEFFVSLLKMTENQNNTLKVQEVLEVLLLFKSKVLCKQKALHNHQQISEQLTGLIIGYADSGTAVWLSEFILGKEYLVDTMCRSTDKQARTEIFNILSRCMKIILLQNDPQEVDHFLNVLLKLVKYPLAKNALRLNQLFEFMLSALEYPVVFDLFQSHEYVARLMQHVLDVQNYCGIDQILELVTRLLLRCQVDRKLYYTYLDRLIDMNLPSVNKQYLTPIVCNPLAQKKDILLYVSLFHQSFYYSGQEIILNLFPVIKRFLLIKDDFSEARALLFFGRPLAKQNGHKQATSMVFDFPSPLNLSQKQLSFLDVLMTQKNKFNLLKYISFLFKLTLKNNFLKKLLISLPSPSPSYKYFFQWLLFLLDIIHKESAKIQDFEYDKQLRFCTEYQQNHQQELQAEFEKGDMAEFFNEDRMPYELKWSGPGHNEESDLVKITPYPDGLSFENRGDSDLVLKSPSVVALVENGSRKRMFPGVVLIDRLFASDALDLLDKIHIHIHTLPLLD